MRGQNFKKKPDNKNKKKKRRENVREQNQCRFCRSKVKYVDFKDTDILGKLLTHRGKIFSRKRSGNCAGCQRKVKMAIKRARFMGLLPFTS
ncbi:MAG: 30S ribosomal protein S18 [Sedimentisphaerales bacterium]